MIILILFLDILSYDNVLKILDDANWLIGAAVKIPYTTNGLQRMDCVIHTHQSDRHSHLGWDLQVQFCFHGVRMHLCCYGWTSDQTSRSPNLRVGELYFDLFLLFELIEICRESQVSTSVHPLQIPTGLRGENHGCGGCGCGGCGRGHWFQQFSSHFYMSDSFDSRNYCTSTRLLSFSLFFDISNSSQ